MRTLRFLLTFVASLVIPLGVLAGWHAVTTPDGTSTQAGAPALIPTVGSLAPDFDLPDLNGSRVRLSDFRGKPVVVVFWADWCGDCKVTVPGFNQLHDEGVPVLGINLMEPRESVAAAVRDEDIHYGVVMDRNGVVMDRNGAAARKFGVQAIPNVFVLDENGLVLERTFSVPQNRFRRAIRPDR